MTTRITYIIILVLAGLILMTLDHLYVEETTWQKHLAISEETAYLARTVTNFFRERTSAVTAVAMLVAARSADAQADAFPSAARAFVSPIPGCQSAALLDEDFSVASAYPSGKDHVPSLDELFSPVGAMHETAIRAQEEKDLVVSDCTLPNRRDAVFFVAYPVSAGAEDPTKVVVAQFNLATLTRDQLGAYLDRIGRHTAVLIGPSGENIGAGRNPESVGLHETHGVSAGSDFWRIRVQQTRRDLAVSTVSRVLLWILGLTLTAGFLFFYSVLARRNRQLQRKEVRLKAQASATREYNERLLQTNRDLDDFTYVVSHDLKEPLRGIEGLTKLLISDHGDRLDDAAREYLRFIKDATGRLQRLIHDLLKLSRATRHEYPHETADIGELVGEVIQSMEYAIGEKGARVTVETPMPAISCDRVRLSELYQNLLSNALKFTNDKAPRVRIGCRDQGESHLFWVADNGIGVCPEHRERIFKIFQRVHTDVPREGTGVGLTICTRIVERHGGRLWVEAEPGGGSRFCFTIPNEEADGGAETVAASSGECSGHPEQLECATC